MFFYLWHNIVPYLEPLSHYIIPNLIGINNSNKLSGSGPGTYRFIEHRHYLDRLLELLSIKEYITLVVYD
jgi:haloalkane dehalogenase